MAGQLLQGSPGTDKPSFPDPAANGCQRWPETLRLLSSNGELVRGRCRSTNLCAYCAKLAAVENSECLAIDAMECGSPEVWAVLTTADANPDPKAFYLSREKVFKAIRRRWPDAEYAAILEFTTGYGPRSRGKRRPHWNLMLKGIPAADLDALADVIRKVWCARENAKPHAQFVGTVNESGGLMRYLALHFQKESQAPPKGWRGHRLTHSRGYFGLGIVETRKRARAQLQFRREVWKIERAHPDLPAELVDELAGVEIERQEQLDWRLVHPVLDDATKAKPTAHWPEAVLGKVT